MKALFKKRATTAQFVCKKRKTAVLEDSDVNEGQKKARRHQASPILSLLPGEKRKNAGLVHNLKVLVDNRHLGGSPKKQGRLVQRGPEKPK